MKNKTFEKIKKYALKNRQTPEYNRRQVGKSMSILAIFLFFVFLINFAIIIGTDQKFGVNLSKGAEVVHQKTVTVAAGGELSMTEMEFPLRRMPRLIMSMPLLTRVTSQLPARFSMWKNPSMIRWQRFSINT